MDQTQQSSREISRAKQIEHGNVAVVEYIRKHEGEHEAEDGKSNGHVVVITAQGQICLLCWSCGDERTTASIRAEAWATVDGGQNPE